MILKVIDAKYRIYPPPFPKSSAPACSTGKHTFSDFGAYCAALSDETLNQGCAFSDRKAAFEEYKCEGQFPQQQGPGKPGDVLIPSGTPDISDVTYQSDIIIREFGAFNGQPDRGALFIILPSRGTIEISQVKGPKTSQSFYVGSLEKVNTKNEIFKQSAIPMADDVRNQLLQKYAGATAIYVEHYETPLCDESSQQFIMDGKLLGADVAVKVFFEAHAQASNDCKMQGISGVMVSNGATPF